MSTTHLVRLTLRLVDTGLADTARTCPCGVHKANAGCQLAIRAAPVAHPSNPIAFVDPPERNLWRGRRSVGRPDNQDRFNHSEGHSPEAVTLQDEMRLTKK